MLAIYTKEINNRLSYVFEFIFKDILQSPFSLVSNVDDFENHQGPKLNYSNSSVQSNLQLKPHSLLFEKELAYQNLEPIIYKNETYFFESSEDSFLPFDPFAASFFAITRYEEYLERDLEKHRRYPARQSILKRNGLLHMPIVNKWAYIVAEKIKEVYPDFDYKKPSFEFLTTIDIDNAWAYKNKSFSRTCGACMKAILKGNFSHVKDRLNVISGKEQDPYDTYNFIFESYKEIADKLQIFVLAGKPGKYDRNVSPENNDFKELIKKLSNSFEVGIHPSYGSVRRKKRLKKEILTLKDIIKKPVDSSRQHFLKLELPKTYRRLIKARIRNDYTLGYAEEIGFRAGTATPFYYYDLKKEKKTSLRIHPFQTMDVTMNNYMHLSPEEAIVQIKKIMQEVKNYGGTFISLWHNESLNDLENWKGWKTVFTEMTNLAITLSDE